MRACIYKRVSDDRANGRSPAEQEAESRAFCDRQGWEVVAVIGDSTGASRHSKGKRAGWTAVRDRLRAGDVDVLVTWEASRAQRDLTAYAELRDLCVEHGVLWSYSGRTHDLTNKDDRFRTGLDALLAELEADTTRERVLRAMRANAADGRPHGRRLYGYRRVYDPSSGALVGQEPHPDEAPLVRRVFAEFAAGSGCRAIARGLNDDGHRTAKGNRWTEARVRQMLRNPGYVGRRAHRGEVVSEGGWPGLVPVDLYERVNARIDAQAEQFSRMSWRPRLLSGVARCGVCGAKMTVSHFEQRRAYRCTPRSCVSRDEGRLDRYVTAVLLDRLERVDLEPGDDPMLTAARARVVVLEARLADAVAEFTAGRLTAGTLARIERDLLPEVKAARREVRRALSPGVEVPSGPLADWWEHELSPEQRRAVVGAVIQSVTVYPTGRGRLPFDPSKVVVEWRARHLRSV